MMRSITPPFSFNRPPSKAGFLLARNKQTRTVLVAAAVIGAMALWAASALAQVTPDAPEPPEAPPKAGTPEDAARLTWWKDARFGMFMHWGLYSQLAGDYKGRHSGGPQIMRNLRIPIVEYEKIAA